MSDTTDILLDSDEKFRVLVEHSVVGIYIIQNGVLTYVNERLANIFGYTREELIGKSNLELTHPKDREQSKENIKRRLSGDTQSIEYSFRGITKNGDIKYIRVYGSTIEIEGKKAILGTLIDETEEKLAKLKLKRLASFDTLTNIFNRNIFEIEIKRSIASAQRTQRKVVLVVFDIDNFKRVNDSLGHKTGDELLITFAKRVQKVLRKSDVFARIGGDEFAIIIEECRSPQHLHNLLKRIKEVVVEPIEVENMTLHISLSVGVALYPEDAKEAEGLQKAADIAMYEAKRQGKNRVVFFNKKNQIGIEIIKLESELYKALENKEFEIYLQPQIALQTHKLVGAEALVRWRHPQKGLITPDQFLTLASEIGVLHKLDLEMIYKAFSSLETFHFRFSHKVHISVNISNALFGHQQFYTEMEKLSKQYHSLLPYMCLELTENILMNDINYSFELMKKLKALGYRFAIDDFGTGYSSLAHLKMLEIDELKIDKSFVDDIVEDKIDKAIVKTIIDMGKTLELITVAEGVERKEQLDILKDFGCDVVQGYYYEKPLSLQAFEEKWLS